MQEIRQLAKRLKRILGQHVATEECLQKSIQSHGLCTIGKYSYNMPEVIHWNEGASLKIGNYCSIAKGVQVLLGGNHRPDWVSTFPFNIRLDGFSYIKGHPTTKGDVIIGNDVWIGQDALILSGVTIGNGVVVGARSVVTKNVPSYSIVAGNPARLIRTRFSSDVCKKLEDSQWWLLDDKVIHALVPLLMSDSIDEFLEEISLIRERRL